MKKLYLLLIVLFGVMCQAWAKPITEAQAIAVGQNFMRHLAKGAQPNIVLQRVFPATIQAGQNPAYFVLSPQTGNAFVMVAGDDASLPILGYSYESSFTTTNLPEHIAKWFENYKEQILYIRANNLPATPEITAEWTRLSNPDGVKTNKNTAVSVSPLLTTKWNQSPHYNALCPYDNINDNNGTGLSVTGCVATAMAQVMKYHNYPAQGTGFHSYSSPYGTLSANFGATTYNWGSMPNIVSSPNSSVATLMYHCGVSVNMSYSAGVSGAWVIAANSAQCSENAFKNYFGYVSTLQGVQRSSYTQANWITLLKTELTALRPLMYAGQGSGGHAFVCDGYDASSLFHFNWGWGGAYDGYFGINALNPNSANFSNNQQAIIGVKPPTGTSTNYNLKLYNNLSLSNTTINVGQAFSVTGAIANYGTGSFAGEYCAGLFNSAGTFISYVGDITATQTLNSNFWQSYTFSSAGIPAATPGTYTINFFYRPTGSNWVPVGTGNGGQQNAITLTVTNNADIRLWTGMVLNPNPIIKGNSFTVSYQIANLGATTYNGDFQTALHDYAGNYISTVQLYTSWSLPAASYYNTATTFTGASSLTSSLAVGNYQIAAWFRPTGSSTWQLMGGNGFSNPINISIVNPPILSDSYEINDTPATAYTFFPSFSSNVASVYTWGSTLHTGTDYDHYKINLPAGYTYTITPRLHDSYNSGNGNTYSCDAIFSYKISAGGSYLETYDTNMASPITIVGGGEVYFWISPYFQGMTGTYLLDVQITRANIAPDVYELNNVETSAYTFSPTFTNEASGVYLSDANFHLTSDHDYYKISLPTGYNYTIEPTLYDAGNTALAQYGLYYSADAQFAYKIGAGNYSSQFNTTSGNIQVTGGGDVYFWVQSTTGIQTGNYYLSVSLLRVPQPTLSVSTTSLSFFRAPSGYTSMGHSFGITSENISNPINVSLSNTDWELSLDAINWQPSYNITPNSNPHTLYVWVRLKSGLPLGTKTATVNVNSTGLPTKTVTLHGKSITPIATTVTVDNTFITSSGFDQAVRETVLQTDGKLIVVGTFTTYNGVSTNRIARLNVNGTLDNTFNIGTGFDGWVNSAIIQPDGKVIVFGYFTAYNGTSVNHVVRLNSNGSIDNTFNVISGFNWEIYSASLQPNGKLIVGGAFTNYAGSFNHIVRLNANGTIDNTFATGTGFLGSRVDKISLQPDGKLIATGVFYSYNGTASNNIARINGNGTLDNTFNVGTGFNNEVFDAILQPDGKILVSGFFTNFNGIVVNKLVRLNTNGTLDTNFNPNFQSTDRYVISLGLQSNGKILVGGKFEDYAGTQMNDFIRLQSNGSLDNTFNTGHGIYGADWRVILLPDDRLLIGNHSTFYNANLVSHLTRLIPPAPITNTSVSALTGFTASPNLPSVSQNLTLSATNINSNITASLSTTDWEISLNNSSWTNSLTINHISGDLPNTLVYVRLKPNAVLGAKNTILTFNSTGATAVQVSLQGNVDKIAQTITFNTLPTKNFGDAPFAVPVSATSGLQVILVSSNPAVATVLGNTITIIGVGSATFTASQAGDANYYPATSVQQVLTVGKTNQTINFATLPAKTFGDAPFVVNPTATSNLAVTLQSSNVAVATVSGNTITIVGAGTCDFTASQGGNANYNPAPDVVRTLTVSKANQTITFNILANKTYGDAPFMLTGSASSNLDIVYTSSNPAVAIVSGNMITIVGAGTATITATQAGNSNYNPATQVSRTLVVNKANQTITFNTLPAKMYGDATFALDAFSSAGLPISYQSSNPAVATVSGNVVTILAVGNTVFTASQAGNDNYNPATSVQQALTVGKANQTINFPALPAKMPGDVPFPVTVSATSGLNVTLVSNNPAVATVSGNVITIVAAGTANITASQAGNANYNPATDVTQVLTVGKQNQTITFPALSAKVFNDLPFSTGASASSGLGLTYQSSNPAVATVTGGFITIIGVGNTVITASQAGSVHFNPAQDVSQVLVVGKANQTIDLPAIADKVFGEAPLTLNATATSGLQVSHTISTVPATGVATLSGNTLTFTGVGSITLTANQVGNTNYNAASAVSRTFQVLYPTNAQPNVTIAELIVYPNPSKSGIFEVRGLQSIDKQQVSYAVVDASGKEIVHGIWAGKDSETLNLSQATNATYLLRLQGSKANVVRKIVKE